MLRNWFFNLRDLDPIVKEHYLKSDSELAAISIGASVFLVLPMSYLDYFYYGFSNEFFESIISELLFVIFCAAIIFFLRRNGQVKTYEILVFTWELTTAIFAFGITVLQPNRVVENILFCLLFLVANFITIPNRLLFRLASAAVIYSAIFIALLTNHTWFAFPDKYMLTLTMFALTGVGMIVIARNNHFKRSGFALQRDEREKSLLFEALSLTDPLTGIPNRRDFFKHAEEDWRKFKRYDTIFCIAVIDLDRFKRVNDTYGHAVGDEVLKQFSNLIVSQLRSTDFFARIGGEEFAFIIRGTHQNDAVKAIARLWDKTQPLKLSSPDLDFPITFSAGIAEARPDDKSLDDTFRRADQAMYRAKELGRDRIEIS
jgi:diguanylate cyclase (GGDEF)-like protein